MRTSFFTAGAPTPPFGLRELRDYMRVSVRRRGESVDAGGNGDAGEAPVAALRQEIRRLPLWTQGALSRVPQEHLAPRGRLAPALEHAAVEKRPAVEVMIDVAGQDEAVDERRPEEQILEALQRTEPDQVAAADAHEVLAHVELPVLLAASASPTISMSRGSPTPSPSSWARRM